jgi:hypothetical protein
MAQGSVRSVTLPVLLVLCVVVEKEGKVRGEEKGRPQDLFG